MRRIISFAPLISCVIIGVLHKVIIALMPLANSQSPLYNVKLTIFREISNSKLLNCVFKT